MPKRTRRPFEHALVEWGLAVTSEAALGAVARPMWRHQLRLTASELENLKRFAVAAVDPGVETCQRRPRHHQIGEHHETVCVDDALEHGRQPAVGSECHNCVGETPQLLRSCVANHA